MGNPSNIFSTKLHVCSWRSASMWKRNLKYLIRTFVSLFKDTSRLFTFSFKIDEKSQACPSSAYQDFSRELSSKSRGKTRFLVGTSLKRGFYRELFKKGPCVCGFEQPHQGQNGKKQQHGDGGDAGGLHFDRCPGAAESDDCGVAYPPGLFKGRRAGRVDVEL